MKKKDVTESLSEGENEEDFHIQLEIENTPEVTYEDPCKDALVPGAYILVDFLGGSRNKTHFIYVCVINSVLENNEFLVTGLKSINHTNTSFVVVDSDTSSVNVSMIQALLPPPTVENKDRRIIYVFPGSVGINEKK